MLAIPAVQTAADSVCSTSTSKTDRQACTSALCISHNQPEPSMTTLMNCTGWLTHAVAKARPPALPAEKISTPATQQMMPAVMLIANHSPLASYKSMTHCSGDSAVVMCVSQSPDVRSLHLWGGWSLGITHCWCQQLVQAKGPHTYQNHKNYLQHSPSMEKHHNHCACLLSRLGLFQLERGCCLCALHRDQLQHNGGRLVSRTMDPCNPLRALQAHMQPNLEG